MSSFLITTTSEDEWKILEYLGNSAFPSFEYRVKELEIFPPSKTFVRDNKYYIEVSGKVEISKSKGYIV